MNGGGVAVLRECEKDEGMTRLVPDIKGADPGAAALLIECRGQTPETLQVPRCPPFSAVCGSPNLGCTTSTLCTCWSGMNAGHAIVVVPLHMLPSGLAIDGPLGGTSQSFCTLYSLPMR